MVQLGFHASHEQVEPSRLLEYVQLAEQAGFQAALCSDHFHPWSERQGQSGFAWSWLGAAMQATRFTHGVVCAPGQRYHPAIIAQAAATLAEMFPERFWLAVGSGEALNEHITGEVWPPKRIRNARLKECVDVMRAMWSGEVVDHDGLVRVRDAKLYTRPEQPPRVFGAALTPQTAQWMGDWADGLITAGSSHDALRRVVDAFRAGGQRKPVLLQSAVCFAATRREALQAAHDQWRHALLDPSLVLNLNMPSEFDAASEFVPPEALADGLRISADASEFSDWIERDIEVGFDAIFFNHVGKDLRTFLQVWGEHILPRFAAKNVAAS